MTTTLFFIGLRIVKQSHKIIHNLRFLLQRTMHFLYPLLALISIVYFILYLINLAIPTDQAIIPQEFLGVLVFLGILFFNADFQTGSEPSHLPNWISLVLKTYCVVLLCLCIIFVYLVFMGNKPNVNFSLILLATLLYSYSYAISAFLPHQKLQAFITSNNIKIALLFLVAMLVINNPIKHIEHTFNPEPSVKSAFTTGPYNNNYPNIDEDGKSLTKYLADIDKKLIPLNLFWKHQLDNTSFIAGYQNHTPIYICRALYSGGSQIGMYVKNQCLISYAGVAIRIKTSDILSSHGKSSVLWKPYPTKDPVVNLGVEPTNPGLRFLSACETEVNGQLYIGKVIFGHCNIVMNESEIILPIKSILVQTKVQ